MTWPFKIWNYYGHDMYWYMLLQVYLYWYVLIYAVTGVFVFTHGKASALKMSPTNQVNHSIYIWSYCQGYLLSVWKNDTKFPTLSAVIFSKHFQQQESIRVGCVPPTCQPYLFQWLPPGVRTGGGWQVYPTAPQKRTFDQTCLPPEGTWD